MLARSNRSYLRASVLACTVALAACMGYDVEGDRSMAAGEIGEVDLGHCSQLFEKQQRVARDLADPKKRRAVELENKGREAALKKLLANPATRSGALENCQRMLKN